MTMHCERRSSWRTKKRSWQVDPREMDQTLFLERLRRFVMVADSTGEVLEISNGYRLQGVESAAEIRGRFKEGSPRLVVKNNCLHSLYHNFLIDCRFRSTQYS